MCVVCARDTARLNAFCKILPYVKNKLIETKIISVLYFISKILYMILSKSFTV